MMRTVLHSCFGLQSGSVYPDDLWGNKLLERCVGHIESLPDGSVSFPAGTIPLMKTHGLPDPADESPAIYVVRDGREVCLSVWDFYDRSQRIEDIISGQWAAGSYRFGKWSHHIQAWRPWDRPNTLLVKYEELTGDLASVIKRLSQFLNCQPIANQIPRREDMAMFDGQWVRSQRRRPDSFPPNLLELFIQHNGSMMQQMGYADIWALPIPRSR